MTGARHLLVRMPDAIPVTLATFLAEMTTATEEGAILVVECLSAGIASACTLRDGRTVHLERRGLFIVGTPIPDVDPVRDAYLDAIGAAMRGRFIPGGDVDTWLAVLPTTTLATVMIYPVEIWPELLLGEVGHARGADRHPARPGATAPSAVLGLGARDAALRTVWSTCRVAREALAEGRPDLAQRALRLLTRGLADVPHLIGARLSARLDALDAEAEAMRARQNADAVA